MIMKTERMMAYAIVKDAAMDCRRWSAGFIVADIATPMAYRHFCGGAISEEKSSTGEMSHLAEKR